MLSTSIINLHSIILNDFLQWVEALTLLKFILMYWPLIFFDLFRALGKTIFLLSYILHRKSSLKRDGINYNPLVSIIIPAHNEEKVIAKSIEAALETNYEHKEIIVVDDGSKDGTFQIAYPYHERGEIKLVRRDKSNGKPGALNYGLLFASGEIVVTIDSDTLLERDSLREIVKPLSDPSINAVAGKVRVLQGKNGSNLLVQLQAYEYLVSFDFGRRFNSLISNLMIISGAFGAFRRKNLRSIGDYDRDTLTEDFDNTLKFRKFGGSVPLAENAYSWTIVPDTWGSWVRQRMRWSRGQIETIWKHRNIIQQGNADKLLAASFIDMVFMDIILLFIRYSWLIFVSLFKTEILPFFMILLTISYVVIESFVFIIAEVISPRKSDLKTFYIIPLTVLFYRPLHSIVRLAAYMSWILKRKITW